MGAQRHRNTASHMHSGVQFLPTLTTYFPGTFSSGVHIDGIVLQYLGLQPAPVRRALPRPMLAMALAFSRPGHMRQFGSHRIVRDRTAASTVVLTSLVWPASNAVGTNKHPLLGPIQIYACMFFFCNI